MTDINDIKSINLWANAPRINKNLKNRMQKNIENKENV